MSIEIDFSKIRPDSKGTRQGGFEEMVVQLFARQPHEAHPDARVNRVEGAGGDGGVEAYADVPGTGKVAVQAKWFTDKLDDSKFRQIDKSVRAALVNHPDLKEYQVYVPLDLTGKKDAKSQQAIAKGKTSKSQREKWNEHVTCPPESVPVRDGQPAPNSSDLRSSNEADISFQILWHLVL